MAAHLNDDDIDLAVQILNGWNEKLTWSEFLVVFAKASRKKISKQAIYKSHARILGAFEDAKDRGRKSREIRQIKGRTTRHGDVALVYEIEKNDRIKSEIETLRRENIELLEQFVRWQYNAHSRGITKEMLDQPLPQRHGKDDVYTMKARRSKK